MLIEFSVSNFRSIRKEQTLNLQAVKTNAKKDNVIRIKDAGADKDFNLLKSILIYGGNASGKSNLIRAFFTFRQFILDSTDIKKGDPISERFYDPYLLDESSAKEPTSFKVTFIGRDMKRYIYQVKFDNESVLEEKLEVYNSIQPSVLFERSNREESVTIKEYFEDKKVDATVLRNNLFLTKIGNSPNKQIGDIYLYFKQDLRVYNVSIGGFLEDIKQIIKKIFQDPEHETFRKLLTKLINIADIRIDDLEVKKILLDKSKYPDEVRKKLENVNIYEAYSTHKVFSNYEFIRNTQFEFDVHESVGTHSAFTIGGLFLFVLLREFPGVIFLDEFDNGLHPELCKFLIELYQSPIVNKNNSQLVVATHETQLLDKDLLRKDQIWISEKNQYGESEFYSVSEFESEDNVREGIPFEKWYKQGKFGGIPNIRKTEFFAQYEEA